MTEEQAKTKWCPQSRKIYHGYATLGGPFGYGYAAAYNRGSKADLKCLASGCMMWRWQWLSDDRHKSDCQAVRTQADQNPLPCDCGYLPNGYCGLAGNEGSP